MKIAILGAGLTGLTLGYLLSQKGLDFEILEKESDCGGLMRSLQEDGFTFDYGGSHVIFSKDKNVLSFMLGILGNNFVKRKRNAKVLHRGKYVKDPFENSLADLSKEDNFECLYYFTQSLIARAKAGTSPPKNLKEWFYYTFGKGIAEKYLIPYNEKVWKYPLPEIGLEWVKRIPNPPFRDILKSSLGFKTEGYRQQLYFYYPKVGGIQTLIQSLAEKTEGKVIKNFEIKRLRKEGYTWVVSDGESERQYDKIISTIPIFDLVYAIDTPQNVNDAANRLKYNSLITVLLGFNVPQISDFSWLYIPDKSALVHRVSFPSNCSPYMVPEGKSSLLAELTCNIGDGIWVMKNEDLIERTIGDLHRLKIISDGPVCFARIKRAKYAYVIGDLGYSDNISAVSNYIKELGIDLVGRFSEFKYLNMDDCIKKAMEYVSALDEA